MTTREIEGVFWMDDKNRRATRTHLCLHDDATLCGIPTVSRADRFTEFYRDSPHLADCGRCKKIAKQIGKEKLAALGF